MRRRALTLLLTASLSLASLPAAAQTAPDIAALRLGMAGRWEGKLEYLDYSANRWFGLPMKVLIEDGGDGVTLIRKADFDDASLKGNLEALLADLIKAKPATAKGQYLQKVSVSSTMGPGVAVDQSSLALK